VYITGLLVLFSYIIAMRPNRYFAQKRVVKPLFPLFVVFLVLFLVWVEPIIILNPIKGVKRFGGNVSRLFTRYNMVTYWLVAIVLLIALLIGVTICYKVAKPLRAYLS